MTKIDPALEAFLLEFQIAKTRIQMFAPAERLEKWLQGRVLQRHRWEQMGHRFVFTGLDAMITTGKKDDAPRPLESY